MPHPNDLAFVSVWPLWLLAALPLLWWLAWRGRSVLAPAHLASVAALRSAALLALILALMQPVWTAPSTQVSVVYALDVSRSVASGFVQSALAFVQRATREAQPAQARYVVFADRARVLDRAEDIAGVGVSVTPSPGGGLLYQGATNLEAALDEALLALDPGRVRRVVLFTDGNQTHGDAWQAVERLAAQGVRVFTFPARQRVEADAWIEALQPPAGLRRDQPAEIALRVVSLQRGRARLSLAVNGRSLATREVLLEPGVNAVALPVRVPDQGMVSLSARVQAPGDALPDNDRLEQAVWVGPRPRVLFVEGQPQAGRYLPAALAAEGIEVTDAAPERVPQAAAELDTYDAVILSDVAAQALGAQRMQALQAYVFERGGGLLFASGENTYGENGYSDSVLEQVLPAQFKAREKRRELALVLCLDRSHSMKGRPLALAKAGARAALGLLDEQHFFGVVAFDLQPYEAVPLQYVRSGRRLEELIDRIQSGGQTSIFPALATALRMLEKQTAARKHVIVLSDGGTAPGDFDRLLARMQDAGITVSTVTIGRSGNPQLMARIADLGGGKNYVAEQIEQLPQLFVEEARNVTQTAVMEEPFKPAVKRRIEAVRGLDFARAPPLLGFVSTRAKDGAEVFLATGTGAPLVARWQYGLGRSVLFSSDVKNRWAAQWLKWEGYGKFWAQLTRDTMRRETGEQIAFSVERNGDEAIVTLRAMSERGEWRNRLAPRLSVSAAQGERRTLAMRQTGPGHYEARLPLPPAGSRGDTLSLIAGPGLPADIARRAGTRRLPVGYPAEYRSTPPDLALLGAIAGRTGGKVGASVAEIFDAQGERGARRTPLWPWLVGSALVMYLLDILLRRASWVRRLFERKTGLSD
jgi:uncharacterized membrane protein